MLVLALLGCNSPHLPDDAEAPRIGSRERWIAELPPHGVPSAMLNHPIDEDLLLVRLDTSSGIELHVADAKRGTVTRYCGAGEFGMPLNAGYAEDAGFWAVIDDSLHLYRDGYVITSCHPDGTVETRPFELTPWPGTAALGDGGHLTWPLEGAEPVWVDYAAATVTPVEGPGAPLIVVKRRDARGLWAVTEDAGSLVLWDVEAASTERLLAIPLGGRDASTATFSNVHPDAMILGFPDGQFATGRAVDGVLLAVPTEVAGYATPWPDASGFAVAKTGLSVDLVSGEVTDRGWATPSGHHLSLSGPLPETVVETWRAGQTETQNIDLSTHFDWLGTEGARVEAFGFENGACMVARWGSGWGVDGSPTPYDEGDIGWDTADTTVFAGRCDGRMETVTRELWLDAAVFGGVIKWDFPVFVAHQGQLVDASATDIFGSSGYRMWMNGWAMSGSGALIPLFSEADAVLVPRRGARFWTLHGNDLYLADVGGALP